MLSENSFYFSPEMHWLMLRFISPMRNIYNQVVLLIYGQKDMGLKRILTKIWNSGVKCKYECVYKYIKWKSGPKGEKNTLN